MAGKEEKRNQKKKNNRNDVTWKKKNYQLQLN